MCVSIYRGEGLVSDETFYHFPEKPAEKTVCSGPFHKPSRLFSLQSLDQILFEASAMKQYSIPILGISIKKSPSGTSKLFSNASYFSFVTFSFSYT